MEAIEPVSPFGLGWPPVVPAWIQAGSPPGLAEEEEPPPLLEVEYPARDVEPLGAGALFNPMDYEKVTSLDDENIKEWETDMKKLVVKNGFISVDAIQKPTPFMILYLLYSFQLTFH